MASVPFPKTPAATGLALFLLAALPSGAGAVAIVTGAPADGEEYIPRAMERIGYRWSPPPGLRGRFSATVDVDIDERGRVTDCRTVTGSGMEAFDISACGAARAAQPLGTPPGGQALTLRCSFLKDTGEGAAGIDPDEALRKRAMRAQRRATERRARDAGFDEEQARARAEAAAAEQEKAFGGYDFVPGQSIPGARQIMARPVRVPKAAAADGQPVSAGPAGEPAARGEDTKPGPVISRWPPRPEGEENALVVTPRPVGDGDAAGAQPGEKGAGTPSPAEEAAPAAGEAGEAKAPAEDAGHARGQEDDSPAPAQPGWKIPQPPTPPEGVRGRVITP